MSLPTTLASSPGRAVLVSGQADTLLVPSEYPSIQAAIDAAVAGDVVLVSPGTYPESIDFLGKAIEVRSQAGPARTTIDGGGQALWVVRMTTGESRASRLEGFTITGGLGALESSGPQGGGIRLHNASPTLEKLRVTGNSGVYGGGIRVAGGAPLLADVVLDGNQALLGGGLYAEMSQLAILGIELRSNQVNIYGGGMWIAGGTLALEDGLVRDNVALQLGAGIYLNHVQVQIQGLDVFQNGLAESQPGGSTIYQTLGGGGFYGANVTGRIRDAVFADNVAAYGGGVYVAPGSTVTLVNALIIRNRSATGGGLYLNSSSPQVVNCTIVDNTVGGIFTTYNSFPVVSNCIVTNNGGGTPGWDLFGNGLAQLSFSLTGPVGNGVSVGAGCLLGNPLLGDSYAPLPGSPVIDAGANAAVPNGVKHDLAGNPRFTDDPDTPDTGTGSGPIVDMGAFEYLPPMPMRFRR
jgi:parallel beta-helix repeat protein